MTQNEKESANESKSGISIENHQDTSLKDDIWINQRKFHTEGVLHEPAQERQDLEEHRERFNDKIVTIKKETYGKNVKMFSNSEYKAKLARLKELKSGGRGVKMLPKDYHLVGKYNILEVQREGGLVEQQLVKVDKSGTRKVCATYEMLFDAISEYHHSAEGKHPGRLQTLKSIKRVYTNITMAQVIAFVDTCTFCKLK